MACGRTEIASVTIDTRRQAKDDLCLQIWGAHVSASIIPTRYSNIPERNIRRGHPQSSDGAEIVLRAMPAENDLRAVAHCAFERRAFERSGPSKRSRSLSARVSLQLRARAQRCPA